MSQFNFDPSKTPVAYTRDGELQKFNPRNPYNVKADVEKESSKQQAVNKDLVSDFISGQVGDFLADSLPSVVIGIVALVLVTLALNAIIKKSSGSK